MKTIIWKNLSQKEQHKILQRPLIQTKNNLVAATTKIIQSVYRQGDKAVHRFTKLYDKVTLDSFQISPSEFATAIKIISKPTKKALRLAAKQITIFHQAQYPKNIKLKTGTGIICEKQARPINRIGLYVPGGSAPLLSTVLMLGIPAQIAKCPLRILCTPPQPDGTIDPHILYAAKLCKIDLVYKIGGAQAIAAMAYGTATIPKVDKIFGPGNSWVTQAKILCAQDPRGAAYDLPAGPSELMVIADETADPDFVAADLLSQAEHGHDSQVFLVTNHQPLTQTVAIAIKKQLKHLSRRHLATKALQHSCLITVDNLTTAIEIANDYAPEHLIIQTKSSSQWQQKITSSGSVFLGKWSPESAGDYASGTNHVLPTYGYAKSYSGLGVGDFMTHITFQKLTKAGLQNISATIENLATIEGLDAHKNAVTIRLEKK